MPILGEEDLFQIVDGVNKKIMGEVYLKYLGDEKKGIKMIGKIPDLWIKTEEGIRGPYICNEIQAYQIMDFNISKGKIWIKVMKSHSLVS